MNSYNAPTRPHLESRWLIDPSLRERSERMRRKLKEVMAKEDARVEADLQSIRAKAKVVHLEDHYNYKLSSYNPQRNRMVAWAFSRLAEEFEEIEALSSSDREVVVFRSAVALLRDQRPVGLTNVLLKGDDHKTGAFTLRVGDPCFFPVSLFVCLYDDDGWPVHLGQNGHLLWGELDGQVQVAQNDLNPSIKAMSRIIRNGGLYCASSWANPNCISAPL